MDRTIGWVVVAAVLSGACTEAANESEPDPGATSEVSATPPPPTPTPEPDPLMELVERLDQLDTFEEAIAATSPFMGDSQNEMSDGALLLSMWAARKLRWQDVFVERDETSFGMVMKHSAPERGKRMCWTGRIVEITHEDLGDFGDVYSGILMTGRYDLIKFVAAGSTGQLVAQSRARFCGATTGKYSYSNSGGGTSHAVQMVGMFRVPENVGE